MPDSDSKLIPALKSWWRDRSRRIGTIAAFLQLTAMLWEFLRDSFPDRRRQRYGDIDYDWEHRVDTSSATVGWNTRLLGVLNSPYQPIPEDEFREIMRALKIDCSQFTFVDVGSGKGRALLLAADHGFKRIIGIEILPELHRIAQQNVSRLRERGVVERIELVCGDATRFKFPAEPMLVFLFNPLHEQALSSLLRNLESAWREKPQPSYIAYANPVHKQLLANCGWLKKVGDFERFSIFVAGGR